MSTWTVGHRVLGLYDVLAVHGEGGMGVVHRVRHTGWDTELAVKSPRPELFTADGDRERFVREAETWVSLGVHPHVCACHYVRTVDGVPHVFAEYLDGGSLREWIDDRRLYGGDPREALARILDIAIQTAWGLQYAHERGLVHQDVKPANVLMDRDGTAKVTDFGLARARGVAGNARPGGGVGPAGGRASVLVSTGGMTPAYASPEQASGDRLGRATDIWSFCVSVLEMFNGGVTWMAGPVAGEALAAYLEDGPDDPGPPRMPAAVAALLARGLDADAGRRPASMGEVGDTLIQVYWAEIGRYRRPLLYAAELRADEWNNRALALLDLGRDGAALDAFESALREDPHHPEATCNKGLLEWREGRITDDALLARLEAVRSEAPDTDRVAVMLAGVHAERGDADTANALLGEGAAPVRSALGSADAWTARCTQSVDLPSSTRFGGMSPDGRHAVLEYHVRGSESKIRLCDLDTGELLGAFETAGHDVQRAVLGGGRAVTAGRYKMWFWTVDTSGSRGLLGRRRRAGRLLRAVEMQAQMAGPVALSGDGRAAVWGNEDWDVTLVEADSGRQLLLGRTFGLAVLGGGLHLVGISADASLALSGGRRTLRLWDTRDDRRTVELNGGRVPPREPGGPVRTMEVPSQLRSLWYGGDGRLALTGEDSGTLRLWDVGSGRCLREFQAHQGAVVSVGLSADGRAAMSAGDGVVRLWDSATGRCLRTFLAHDPRVLWAALDADGRRIVSAQQERSLNTDVPDAIRVWDVAGGERYTAPYLLCRPRTHAELTRSADRVAELVGKAEQALADGRHGAAFQMLTQARALPGHERSPQVLPVWGRLTAVSRKTGVAGLWIERDHAGHQGRLEAAAFSADGRLVLTRSGTEAHLRVTRSGLLLRGFHDVNAACLAPDGRLVLLAGTNGRIRMWDVPEDEAWDIEGRERGFEGRPDITSIRLGADGRSALTVETPGPSRRDRDIAVRLWDLPSGRCLRVVTRESSDPVRVAWSGDGRFILTLGDKTIDDDGYVIYGMSVVDLRTGGTVRYFPARRGAWTVPAARSGLGGRSVPHVPGPRTERYPSDSVRHLRTVSDDGRLVLSDGQSRVVVWDHGPDWRVADLGAAAAPGATAPGATALAEMPMDTAPPVRVMDGEPHWFASAAFTADGRFLMSGGTDGTVRMWDLASGRCLREAREHDDAIGTVAISADGCFGLSADGLGVVRVWRIDWEIAPPADDRTGPPFRA